MKMYLDKNCKEYPCSEFNLNSELSLETTDDVMLFFTDYNFFLGSIHSAILNNKNVSITEYYYDDNQNKTSRPMMCNIISAEIPKSNIKSLTLNVKDLSNNKIKHLNFIISDFIPRDVSQDFDLYYINCYTDYTLDKKDLYKFRL